MIGEIRWSRVAPQARRPNLCERGCPMNEMTRIIAAQPAYSEAAQKMLAREPRLFIGGEWVASSHDATLPIFDPSTGREIGRFVDASDQDVDRAVAAART